METKMTSENGKPVRASEDKPLVDGETLDKILMVALAFAAVFVLFAIIIFVDALVHWN